MGQLCWLLRYPWNLMKVGMALKRAKVELRQPSQPHHTLNIWRAAIVEVQENPHQRHSEFHEVLRVVIKHYCIVLSTSTKQAAFPMVVLYHYVPAGSDILGCILARLC